MLSSKALSADTWLQRLEKSNYTYLLLFALSMGETLILPIPIEAILIPWMLRKPEKRWVIAAVALAGNITAASLGYWLGALAMEQWGDSLIQLFGGAEVYDSFATELKENGFMSVLAVGIVLSFAAIDRFLAQTFGVGQVLMGGLLAALLFSLLGWGLARWITRPLLDLADVARGLEAGYAVKAPASNAYEEVAILGTAFNGMVKTLQHNEEELRQLNVSLERRVMERTAELQSSFERMDDSEARTRAVIETAQEPFIGMDFEGCITDWNPQAEKLFGWRADEALGESLAHLVVPVRYQVAFIEALATFHQTGNAPFVGQRMRRILVDRQGEELPVEMKIGLINTERLKLFSAFIRDLREQA